MMNSKAPVVHAADRMQSSDLHPRILVVDDDSQIRRMIVAALRRDAAYDFLEAANGREALELMRESHPAVVVLDLMMPVVSGWEVLEERAKASELNEIPVIVVSANREPALADAVDKGICAFLPKPFDITALSALVKSCIPKGMPAIAPDADASCPPPEVL